MMRIINDNKGFGSLIGILITLIIIGFLIVKAMDGYFAGSSLEGPAMDEETKEAVEAQGIDTSSKKGAYTSAIEQIGQIEQRNINRGDELLKQMSGK